MNLCTFIGHKWVQKEEWIPSFYAETITEYKFTNICVRCKKKDVLHEVWNGKEFEKVDPDFGRQTQAGLQALREAKS